jgi:ubiquinone/menaquinone biosynthesis C-methylase UbiE
MLPFDSPEYWQRTTWDRYTQLEVVPPPIRDEFLTQERLVVSAVEQFGGPNNGKLHMLDLACGTGKITESILKRCGERICPTLVDFNPHTLAIAKARLSGFPMAHFVELDSYVVGATFPQKFDVVICTDFLHHSSNLHLLCDEISKALKPGGLLIANTFVESSYAHWDRLKYGTLKSIFRRSIAWLAMKAYSKSPAIVSNWIRVFGLARIAPLSPTEIMALLSSRFEIIDSKCGYYFWFCARRMLH